MAAYTTIDDPEAYFQVKAYTGNYDTNAITLDGTTNMQGDLIWLKQRDGSDGWHCYDSVRGVAEQLRIDDDRAESTTSGILASFDTDGFTLGANNAVNESGADQIAWVWKAGTTSGLSGGDITPAGYSINTTSKVGIYKYRGDGTVGGDTITHGLGSAPKFVIIKQRTDAYEWAVWCDGVTITTGLRLNNTAAETTNDFLHNTLPGASTIRLGSSTYSNAAAGTKDYVMYLFSPVQGFSKFSHYTGNGNADGPFINTGFKVRFVLIKNAGGVETWNIWDSKRTSSGGGNLVDKDLSTTHVRAEQTGTAGVKVVDFLSNGFKIRGSNTEINQSGNTHIYMAFAEAPFVNSNEVPCTAR